MGPREFLCKLLAVIIFAVSLAVLTTPNGPELFVHKLLGLF